MDHSISSLAYQGSIVEAIVEAKRQKKLLVVYLSGDNAESGQLEGSTWINPIVADSISKYCVLLHVLEGSAAAVNFSAIYPQKSPPCITAVGYNGVQLWQQEGFVDAETLTSSLQKAWLSLHIQETLLTAALVSKSSEQQDTSSTTFQQGTSSGMDIAPLSVAKNAESLDDSELDSLEIENSTRLNDPDRDCEETDINIGSTALPGSVSANIIEGCEDRLATSSTESSKAALTLDKLDEISTKHVEKAIEDKSDTAAVDEKKNLGVKTETSQVSHDKEPEGSRGKRLDVVQDEKLNRLETLSKPTEVHLNIRLLDGSTLQNKFPLTSTLEMVKHYVDANQENVRGSYDFAIPYPRKVFNDRDLSRTLSELGLVGRQALIVIKPDQSSSSSVRQRSSTSDSISLHNSNSGGYFSLLKGILSYVNPLSYLGGGTRMTASAQEAQGNVGQYGPDPGLRNTFRGTNVASPSTNQSTPSPGRNSSSKQATSRFGSNIHTLKHDEDDRRTSDRNNFWNGNSTQYGGDGDPK